MDNVYSGHWSTDYNRAKYITMGNKKVNSRVWTDQTPQSTKVPSLHLATYGWLIGKKGGGAPTGSLYRTFVFSVRS